MNKSGRIAFINCRTYTGGSGLITIPFAFNTVLKLQHEWQIDLLLGELPNTEYNCQLSANVNLRFIHKALTRRSYLKEADLLRSCLTRINYSAVFGMGQIGVYIAYILAKLNRCPLIVFNDEFPSCFGRSRWTEKEAKALRNADIICVPDINRVKTLCREVPGIASKTFIEILNTPIRDGTALPKLNWHQRLGLKPGTIPVICAGGMGDHNQIPELLYSVHSWPDKYVLILRGNNPVFAGEYRDTLRHLDIPNRTIWYLDPLSTADFESLFQYCRASVALYRWQGDNMIEMGKASGKILRSISLGVPVIATNFPSLSFVASSRTGVLINHPSEISSAIQRIDASHSDFSSRCIEFGQSVLSYENCWAQLKMSIERVSGLALGVC
jgi:glycosyltransferase involved in cell wall biosynthesis